MNQILTQAKDSDSIFFNFRDDFGIDPEAAIANLQILLPDAEMVRWRVASLRESRNILGNELKMSPTVRTHSAEVKAFLTSDELFDANLANQLTPEMVEQIHYLLCDPDALLEVHQTWHALIPEQSNPDDEVCS